MNIYEFIKENGTADLFKSVEVALKDPVYVEYFDLETKSNYFFDSFSDKWYELEYGKFTLADVDMANTISIDLVHELVDSIILFNHYGDLHALEKDSSYISDYRIEITVMGKTKIFTYKDVEKTIKHFEELQKL